jgi:hypothetical protein
MPRPRFKLPDKLPESYYQGLVDVALTSHRDSLHAAIYLDLAQQAGYNPQRIYNLAISGRADWPTDYQDFRRMVAHTWERLGGSPSDRPPS